MKDGRPRLDVFEVDLLQRLVEIETPEMRRLRPGRWLRWTAEGLDASGNDYPLVMANIAMENGHL